MSIFASCPACGLPLQLPDAAAGRTFACVGCGRNLATEEGGRLVVAASAPTFTPAFHYGPRPLTRGEAVAKVQGPAVMLIVYGFLWGLLGLMLPLFLLAEEFRKEEFSQPIIAIGASFSIAVGAFTIFCGLRLMALRSFTLVMLCIVLNIVLGLMGCWLMALPAIWPLVVIMDGKVKPHFRP